jgi:hypothetical protein
VLNDAAAPYPAPLEHREGCRDAAGDGDLVRRERRHE